MPANLYMTIVMRAVFYVIHLVAATFHITQVQYSEGVTATFRLGKYVEIWVIGLSLDTVFLWTLHYLNERIGRDQCISFVYISNYTTYVCLSCN